jgi:transposase
MGIRRRCRGPCQTTRRCLEHLWFDVTYRGTRYRMPVNEFAVPRMQPGTQRPVESIEEARDWERLFIGEIKGGRDPRNKPALRVPETDLKVCRRVSRRVLRAAGQARSSAEYRYRA